MTPLRARILLAATIFTASTMVVGSPAVGRSHPFAFKRVEIASLDAQYPVTDATPTPEPSLSPEVTASPAEAEPSATPTPTTAPKASSSPVSTPTPQPQDCVVVKVETLSDKTLAELTAQTVRHVETYRATYYDIYGFTRQQIVDQMNRCGPDYRGQSNKGLTLISMQYGYWLTSSNGQCAVDRYVTHRNVDIFYPRWNDGPSSSQDLRTRWTNYDKSMVVHEEGHRAHGAQTAQKVTDYFDALPSYASCSDVSARVEVDVPAIINSMDIMGQQYDAQTGSGNTQLIYPNVLSD
ncbi:MAG TPA: DUF922 domain-containing protein [Verrucomicrobiae bacterium]|nr:DUF922 domain-containing protein [Verrucomicrobiae bacterium]